MRDRLRLDIARLLTVHRDWSMLCNAHPASDLSLFDRTLRANNTSLPMFSFTAAKHIPDNYEVPGYAAM